MLIGIIGNTRKSLVPDAVRHLVDLLRQRDTPYLLHDALFDAFEDMGSLGDYVSREELRDRSDAVIAFGGDGTMLSASRFLAGSDVPLLGVNLGKLGFLAEFSLDSLEQTVDELLDGQCKIVHRSLLKATFPDDPDLEPLIGMNDIVVDKRNTGLMIRLETYVNGDFLGAYNADGLILATPTGSTAYALAVGGPVVAPNSRVTVIAPIAPHMLTARPVVVPDDAVIDIYPVSPHNQEETAHVYADGQTHHYLPMPTKISVTRYDYTACLVKRTSRTYFDILRAKLLWGREPILNNNAHTRKDGKL